MTMHRGKFLCWVFFFERLSLVSLVLVWFSSDIVCSSNGGIIIFFFLFRFWLEHVDYKYFMTNNLQQRMFAVGEFIWWGGVATKAVNKRRHLSTIKYVEWLNAHGVVSYFCFFFFFTFISM